MHSLYNLALLLAATLHVDVFGDLAGRSEFVGSPVNLIPGTALIFAAAVIWWMTRSSGPVLTASAERAEDERRPTSEGIHP